MNRQQRYRYEMFVRVRDFGTANEALFAVREIPEYNVAGAGCTTSANAHASQ
jgi:hypothetical protein